MLVVLLLLFDAVEDTEATELLLLLLMALLMEEGEEDNWLFWSIVGVLRLLRRTVSAGKYSTFENIFKTV